MEASGRDKGVRSKVAAASGSPNTGPSTVKCTGAEAMLQGSRGMDETPCPGGRDSHRLLSALDSWLALKDKMVH